MLFLFSFHYTFYGGRGHVSLVVSKFASQLQGLGINSHLCPVWTEHAGSPCASQGGFPQATPKTFRFFFLPFTLSLAMITMLAFEGSWDLHLFISFFVCFYVYKLKYVWIKTGFKFVSAENCFCCWTLHIIKVLDSIRFICIDVKFCPNCKLYIIKFKHKKVYKKRGLTQISSSLSSV